MEGSIFSGKLPILFWFQYFEIIVTSHQLDYEFKSALVNSKLRDSAPFDRYNSLVCTRQLELPDQCPFHLSIAGMQCGMQSSMISSVKLEKNNPLAFRPS